MEVILDILDKSWLLLGQMSVYLLLGFLVAGILSVCVSPAWVERHLGRPGLGSVMKASLFGVPLPLCSCGVIPVAASIHRHGASRGATTSFLLSTPQTGVDSIAVTLGSLGTVVAIFRPVAALLTGLIGGILVQVFDDPPARTDAPGKPDSPACQEPCCAKTGPRNVLLRALHYGFVTLPRDIGGALLVGIAIAGAMAALVKPDQLEIGSGILAILLVMALSVPIYVCATASVPIAYALVHVGVSPGAALAFLIAGPATNAATFTTIWKLLGRRTAVLYIATVAAGAIAAGLLLDWLFPGLKASMPKLSHPAGQTAGHAHHASQVSWLTHLGAVALLAIMMISSKTMARLTQGKKLAGKEQQHADASSAGQRLDLAVGGMTCSHCAESVRRALAECAGVSSVEVDLADGRAVVTGERLDRKQLADAVTELGYTASLPNEGT